MRTEEAAFRVLCTALELEVRTDLLNRLGSNTPFALALATLPWLSTRAPASPHIAALGRALAPHKSAADLAHYLCREDARADGLLKGALSVVPLTAPLIEETAPLLASLGSFAPSHLHAAVSRLCRLLLSNQRCGQLFLDASQHLLRAAVVHASPAAFPTLLPVYARAVRMAAKDLRSSGDSAHTSEAACVPASLRLPTALAEQPATQCPPLSARLTRLVESTPALAAQANAHQYLTMRQRTAARSVLGEAEERALAELQRLAANGDAERVDLKDLQDMLGGESLALSIAGVPPLNLTLADSDGGKSKAGPLVSAHTTATSTIVIEGVETREPEAEDQADADDTDDADDADVAELDRLIAAAESKFRGFDLAALAEATAALSAMNA